MTELEAARAPLNAELDRLSTELLGACERYVQTRSVADFRAWQVINARYVATHRRWWELDPDAPPYASLFGGAELVTVEPKTTSVRALTPPEQARMRECLQWCQRDREPTEPEDYAEARLEEAHRRWPDVADLIGFVPARALPARVACSHKFVDSARCVLCGWDPSPG